MRVPSQVLAVLLLGVVTIAGCAGDEDTSSLASETEAAQDNGGVAAADGSGGEPVPVQGDAGGVAAAAADREIIRTGQLAVEVADVEAAVRTVEDLIAKSGGFLSGTDVRRDPEVRATLVLRVPNGDVSTVLEALRSLGDVATESVTAEDVTAEVVDLDIRIRNAEASIDRIRVLLDQAQAIPDVVSLENELATRVTNLESIQGRRRVLGDLTALATLTVELRQPRVAAASDDIPGFLSGLREGWVAFVNTARVVATVGGFLLPFGAALAVVVVPVVWWRRRRPPIVAEPPSVPPPPPASGGGGGES